MSRAAASAAALQAIRARRPLIHNVTNLVAMEMVANCLLALGASPAMVMAEEEVEDIVGLADALVLNTGTLTATSARAMQMAAARAGTLVKPWVLDPVGVGGTPHRTRIATGLRRGRPLGDPRQRLGDPRPRGRRDGPDPRRRQRARGRGREGRRARSPGRSRAWLP